MTHFYAMSIITMVVFIFVIVFASIMLTIEKKIDEDMKEIRELRYGRYDQLRTKLRGGYVSKDAFARDYNEWAALADIQSLYMYKVINEKGLWKIKSKVKGFY